MQLGDMLLMEANNFNQLQCTYGNSTDHLNQQPLHLSSATQNGSSYFCKIRWRSALSNKWQPQIQIADWMISNWSFTAPFALPLNTTLVNAGRHDIQCRIAHWESNTNILLREVYFKSLHSMQGMLEPLDPLQWAKEYFCFVLKEEASLNVSSLWSSWMAT